MKVIIPSLLFAIALESTIISAPLTLIVLLFSAIYARGNIIFLLAFLSGLILDILALSTIGLTSIYFVTFVYLIFLYQRKFEAKTLHFLTIFSFLGSLLFLFLQREDQIILQSILLTVIVIISFLFYKKPNKKNLNFA